MALLTLLAFASACGSETQPVESPEGASSEAPVVEAAPSPSTGSPGWFSDATASSGLQFVHESGITAERQLPETMGAGAALTDVDGDGDLDVYFVQSGQLPVPPTAPGETSRPGDGLPPPTNALYLNDGRGRFTDATASSGAAADEGYGMGVAVGDVNGDGSHDLFVTNLGPDVLLANDGSGTFRDVTAGTDLADERWTGSAAFFDADLDGDLDLYVAAYVDIDLANPEWCGKREDGWRSYCHPDAFDGLPDRFYINDGSGGFRDATAAAGLTTRPGHHGKGLGVLATDFDDDGLVDLYVANDSVENRMWLNLGGGRFADGTLISATGVNGRGLTEAGMGVAAGDVDGDTDGDLFVTNFDDESNTLYRNDGDGLFTDVTARAGLDAASRLPVGFGTVLSDLDADGDLDIAVANGHIIDNIALYHDGKAHAQLGLLFANDGRGRFTDVSSDGGDLTAHPYVGRGLYSGDLDGDGALDLLLTRCGGRALLLHNEGPPAPQASGASVILAGLPRDTRVEAVRADGQVLVRRAGPQPSYFGQTSDRVQLGLAGSALTQLELRLPNGESWRLVFDPPLAPELATSSSAGMLIWTGSGGLRTQGPSGTMGETLNMTTNPPSGTDR